MSISPIPGSGLNGFIQEYVLNDTGSNVLSIRQIQANQLGITNPNYLGYLGLYPVRTADGIQQRVSTMVQILLHDDNGNALGTWIREDAVVVPDAMDLLSGTNMRAEFYFATPKANDMLVIAKTRNALTQALPVR